jgi:hypothetical protein
LKGIGGIATQQQSVAGAKQAQATAQAAVSKWRMGKHMQSSH